MSQSVQRCLWNLICPCEALLFCCLDHSPVRCAAMNHQLLHRTVEKLRTSQSGTRLCPDTQYRVSIYLQSQALSLSASSRAFYWWLSCGKAVLNQGTYGQPWTTWTAVELSKTYKQTSTYTLSMLSPLPWNLFSHYLAHSRTWRGSWGVAIVLWTALLHHWKTRNVQLRTSGVWWTVWLCAFL